MSYWSIFEGNLVGLADFAGSQFQSMANWPSFDFSIETGWTARNRPPVSYNSPSFDFFYRNRAIWPSVGIWACKIGQSHYIPLGKWPVAHWGSRGHFFNVPGEKACQSVEKCCFVSWNDNCRPDRHGQWKRVTQPVFLLKNVSRPITGLQRGQ